MFRQIRRIRQLLTVEETAAILKCGKTGVLGVNGDDGYPYTVPVNYAFEDGKIYFHCAGAGHKWDAIRKNGKVSFCVIDRDDIAPAKFTTLFRSVIAFGRAVMVEEPVVKRYALDLLVEKYAPDDPEAGAAEIEKAWQAVHIVEITIEQATGKQGRELVKRDR
ncbi:pyridoxamine 5'-phosphate oxidase family protein [Sporolactobacillus vineae]|uniref:pyridoxamine 5'-phosphate oxidase family protein n=1 Tax=Sporolactobacillus vineae TaxID=444463 RepID=UPI000287E6EB|nr:pyridoxamine 5'-phosphate oxidase family protein [Sporolactobacillus vineae]